MLWGDRGLARVVRRGVRWGWGILGGDAVLWRRGVLGRGVGLGHRFRRSRGVLIALRRRQQGWLDRGVGGTPPPFTGPSLGGPVVPKWTFSSIVQAAWEGSPPARGTSSQLGCRGHSGEPRSVARHPWVWSHLCEFVRSEHTKGLFLIQRVLKIIKHFEITVDRHSCKK